MHICVLMNEEGVTMTDNRSAKYLYALHESRHAAMSVWTGIGLKALAIPPNDAMCDWKARLYYTEPSFALNHSPELMKEFARAKIIVSLASYVLEPDPNDECFRHDRALVDQYLKEHFTDVERDAVTDTCHKNAASILTNPTVQTAVEKLAIFLEEKAFNTFRKDTLLVAGYRIEHELNENGVSFGKPPI